MSGFALVLTVLVFLGSTSHCTGEPLMGLQVAPQGTAAVSENINTNKLI